MNKRAEQWPRPIVKKKIRKVKFTTNFIMAFLYLICGIVGYKYGVTIGMYTVCLALSLYSFHRARKEYKKLRK